MKNTKPKQAKKSKPKPTCKFKNCSRVCISLCTNVVHNISQNSSDYFPRNLQTIITAQMLSIGMEKETPTDFDNLWQRVCSHAETPVANIISNLTALPSCFPLGTVETVKR